ncbi:hypothetical protein CEXT_678231 [Caerostris extrusa]|uniref:Uncharacterized protein n=1 Tax=Caerostris extrusa TaxID=172846 RepID=A0AAV4Y6H3_CAEEX|nr:hypothetical protein CEXT_678231 [Caerostris extrusa]
MKSSLLWLTAHHHPAQQCLAAELDQLPGKKNQPSSYYSLGTTQTFPTCACPDLVPLQAHPFHHDSEHLIKVSTCLIGWQKHEFSSTAGCCILIVMKHILCMCLSYQPNSAAPSGTADRTPSYSCLQPHKPYSITLPDIVIKTARLTAYTPVCAC